MAIIRPTQSQASDANKVAGPNKWQARAKQANNKAAYPLRPPDDVASTAGQHDIVKHDKSATAPTQKLSSGAQDTVMGVLSAIAKQ